MWNIDIENRIRHLDAEAEDHQARLFNTMTETDGSAKGGSQLISRIVQRMRQTFGASSGSSRPAVSRPVSLVSGK